MLTGVRIDPLFGTYRRRTSDPSYIYPTAWDQRFNNSLPGSKLDADGGSPFNADLQHSTFNVSAATENKWYQSENLISIVILRNHHIRPDRRCLTFSDCVSSFDVTAAMITTCYRGRQIIGSDGVYERKSLCRQKMENRDFLVESLTI